MSKYLIILVMTSFLFAAQESPQKVTLEDAKKYAISHNFEVISLRRALDEAEAKEARSRSPYFPKLGVAGGADNQLIATGNVTAAIAYVYFDYNLFNGFSDLYKNQIASQEKEKAQIKLKRSEFRVGLEVERTFHLYVFKKSVIKLKEEALKWNEIHKKMAAQKKRAGLSSDSDVMEFDLKDAVLRSDLLLLNQELEEARTQLKKLLGEEIGSKIEPIGSLQHQHLKGNLNNLVKRIKNESEVVVTTAKDLSIANLESKVTTSKWLPKLDLEVSGGFLPWDLRQVPAGQAMIGGKLVLKYDIFSGFDNYYGQNEAEAKKLKLEAQLKDAILSAMVDTENAFRKIRTIQERVDLEEENEERAQKYYKSVMSEYKRGVKNSADLRVAADGLFEVSLKRESYKYEFLNSRIDLEKALGGPVEVELMHEEEPKKKS
jgi:outer membrane protein TolC